MSEQARRTKTVFDAVKALHDAGTTPFRPGDVTAHVETTVHFVGEGVEPFVEDAPEESRHRQDRNERRTLEYFTTQLSTAPIVESRSVTPDIFRIRGRQSEP
ncbi:MAG: hypothetical protein OXI79_08705 [Gammaproteobacteria bacterium]|nr:hypothetical protein [Gammaproteobacteria bacterium]